MAMGLLASLFFGFAPALLFAYILYWLDRYEKEPKILLGGVFLWGAVVAAGSAFIINTFLDLGVYLFTQSDWVTELAGGSIIAPIVEESLKGLAVFIVFLVFRKEFDSVLDGIVYAGVAALGFAAVENSYYIYNYGFKESGWEGFVFLVFVRVILVGWQHPFYTAFSGIGLAAARLTRNAFGKLIFPLLGLGAAMFTHAVHNTLATFLSGIEGLAIGAFVDWTGWFFMFLFILWAISKEQQYIRKYLWEEVRAGSMMQNHYRTAASAWLQSLARMSALFNGRLRYTARFYQLCGELAHKKRQYATLGDEGGDAAAIQKLRAELARLAPYAQV
jgi:RsiW-degrading membrane proteinase PrsW (M82 family)